MATAARLLAVCGLDCATCPAYVATQKNDLAAKQKIAGEWSTAEYPLTAEQVLCDGCATSSSGAQCRVMSFCTACTVRQCASKRGLVSCAHCPDYGCEILHKVWSGLGGGEAQANLEALRAELGR